MQEKNTGTSSRRELLKLGMLAGVAGATNLVSWGFARPAFAMDHDAHDIAILNVALGLEDQAIWAYRTAAGKLTNSAVGQTVKYIAVQNMSDHIQHRVTLEGAIRKLGGSPVHARSSYDLSSYIHRGEGNLDSDANIAKLALALEVDAVLAYQANVPKLRMPSVQMAALGILPDEASHAAAIRTVFHTLDKAIKPTPAAMLDPQTRSMWILKV